MNLYLVQRIGMADWDEYRGFVIRAKSYADARRIASAQVYGRINDAEPNLWMDATKSKVTLLTPDGVAGVILSDFKAG